MSQTYCLPDCPRRSAYCHATCPDYAPIEKARMEKAKKNAILHEVSYMMLPGVRSKRFRTAMKAANKQKNRRQIYG